MDLPLFAVISKKVVTTPKIATRRFSRIVGAPSKLVDFACIVAINEPLMWQEVFIKEDVNKWKEIIDEKYQTFMKTETRDLTKLPKGRKAIRSKWVFHVKKKTRDQQD
jgi:hypothetical protein